jgi:phosphoglycerate dehydrogenase-like enzyme
VQSRRAWGCTASLSSPGTVAATRRSIFLTPISVMFWPRSLMNTKRPSPSRVVQLFGHEPAIAEYVLMMMLSLTHRLLETMTAFRGGSWAAHQPAGGSPHGELLGKTVGIMGYGRIGREVAKRAVGFGCKVIAANRSPIADKGEASAIYPLGELDRMLPHADVVRLASGRTPEA